MSSDFLYYSAMNSGTRLGGPKVLDHEINKHALWITITKSWRYDYESISFVDVSL